MNFILCPALSARSAAAFSLRNSPSATRAAEATASVHHPRKYSKGAWMWHLGTWLWGMVGLRAFLILMTLWMAMPSCNQAGPRSAAALDFPHSAKKPETIPTSCLNTEKCHQRLLRATSGRREESQPCFLCFHHHIYISLRVTSPWTADRGAEAKCCFRQHQGSMDPSLTQEKQHWLAQDSPEEQKLVSLYSGIKHCHPVKAASPAAIQT